MNLLKTKTMARTSTYLNFTRNTEEAFNFYKSVFGGDFVDGKINRFGEIPEMEGMPPIAEDDKELVMHIALPILGGHLLMGTDAPESMGFIVNQGNNVNISLHPDSRSEADTLFGKLADGGAVEMPMQDMFWGDYYGALTDKFGIKWMVNYSSR
jgi:PhnB protein